MSAKLGCPRCGGLVAWIERRDVGGRVYYYAVHVYKDSTGKRRIKKCYLGPLMYEYVSRLHKREGLVLRGLVDADRVLGYLDAIISYLELNPLEPELALKLAEKFRAIAERLEEHGRRRGEAQERSS